MRPMLSSLAVVALGACGGQSIETVVGVDGKRILSSPDRIEVFRIHGYESQAGGRTLRGYPILAEAVKLRPDFARRAAAVLLQPGNYEWLRKKCAFTPGVALRFWRVTESVDVLLCFSCNQCLFAFGPEVRPTWDHTMDCDRARPLLLDLAREAFPDDAALAALDRTGTRLGPADWLPRVVLGDAGERIAMGGGTWVVHRLGDVAKPGNPSFHGYQTLAAPAALAETPSTELRGLILTPESYDPGALRSEPFSPEVAFRLGTDAEHLAVLVSFAADTLEFVVQTPGQPTRTRRIPFARARPFLVELARTAFPEDPALEALAASLWLGPDVARVVLGATGLRVLRIGGDPGTGQKRVDGHPVWREKWWHDATLCSLLARLLFAPPEAPASQAASQPATPDVVFRLEYGPGRLDVLVHFATSRWEIVAKPDGKPEFRRSGSSARAREPLLDLARRAFPEDGTLGVVR
jgi:hypothetical protein